MWPLFYYSVFVVAWRYECALSPAGADNFLGTIRIGIALSDVDETKDENVHINVTVCKQKSMNISVLN